VGAFDERRTESTSPDRRVPIFAKGGTTGAAIKPANTTLNFSWLGFSTTRVLKSAHDERGRLGGSSYLPVADEKSAANLLRVWESVRGVRGNPET